MIEKTSHANCLMLNIHLPTMRHRHFFYLLNKTSTIKSYGFTSFKQSTTISVEADATYNVMAGL